MKKVTNVGASLVSAHRKNKGITLIALIITIIVMLILIMVSIQVLFNTGLFDAAGKATQKWNAEQEKEANMKLTIGNKTYGSVEDYMNGEEEKEVYDEVLTAPETYAYSFQAGDDIIAYVVLNEEATAEKGENVYDMLFVGTGEMYPISSWNTPIVSEIMVWDCGSMVGSGEYKYNIGLESVKISKGITNISRVAFWESSLTNIKIPTTVTSIGNHAFRGCSSLTSIEIPDGVTSIGNHAFTDCSLISIKVAENNSIYDSRENCNAIIEKNTNTLILGCKNTEIPYSVISIGDSAFFGCSSLTSIEIPDSITSIGEHAFQKCSSLTSIEIPDGVTSIEFCAFYECRSLTSIEIPDSVTSIEDSAFGYCDGLSNVYYTGTEEEWKKISISSRGNSDLTNATIHYNYTPST